VQASQAVGEDPRGLGADPPGVPCGGRDLAVDGLGEFERDKGDPGPDVLEEDLVDLPALRVEDAGAGLDPVPLQRCEPPPRDKRIGVDRPDDDAGRLFLHQPLDAGRGFAVVGAGFQGDVDRCTADRLRRALDGVDLGVIFPAAPVEPFPDDAPVLDDHRPHEGVGRGPGRSPSRQGEGRSHVALVGHARLPLSFGPRSSFVE